MMMQREEEFFAAVCLWLRAQGAPPTPAAEAFARSKIRGATLVERRPDDHVRDELILDALGAPLRRFHEARVDDLPLRQQSILATGGVAEFVHPVSGQALFMAFGPSRDEGEDGATQVFSACVGPPGWYPTSRLGTIMLADRWGPCSPRDNQAWRRVRMACAANAFDAEQKDLRHAVYFRDEAGINGAINRILCCALTLVREVRAEAEGK